MAGCGRWPDLDDAAFMASLPLSQTSIDFDVERRGEEGLIERLVNDAATRVVLVNGGMVAVPRHAGDAAPGALFCFNDPAAPRPDAVVPEGVLSLALLIGSDVRDEALRPGALVIYLGIDRTEGRDTPYLALDISRPAPVSNAAHVRADQGIDGAASSLAVRALQEFDWVELREFAPCAAPFESGIATTAVALVAWHASQRFCPACGAPVRPILSGWAQTCTSANDPDRLLFPRIEPAVITAIVDDDDRILLQNNAAWRERFYSVSAGFVEAGESLEHAVRREAREEVGVELDEVRYLGSQPWPFPASIMLGFRAHARRADIAVDHEEVSRARWFSREELRRVVEAGELELPGRASIARHMIEQWYGGPLGQG